MAEELKAKGNAFFKEGKYEEAIKCFTQALEQKPEDEKILSNRSVCLSKIGKYEEALRDADAAIKQVPTWFRAHDRRATALMGLQRPKEAAEARREEGNCYFRGRDYIKALQAYNEGLQCDNTNHLLCSNRSACFMNLGRYEDAVRDSDRCLELDPSFVKAYVRKGQSLLKLLDVKGSKEALDQGRTLAPNNESVVSALAATVAAAEQVQANGPKLAALFGGASTSVAMTQRVMAPAASLAVHSKILLYFSAHWCPPCRQFTPLLVRIYHTFLKPKNCEVVFVSSDHSVHEMMGYINEVQMPWRSLTYGDAAIAKLSQHFGVSGIPALIVLNSDGAVISKNGTSDVQMALQNGQDPLMRWG